MEKKVNKLIAVIGKGPDDYGAWFENMPGAYGAGETVEAAKQSLKDGLKYFIEYNDYDTLPEILKGEYEIEFFFEAESFLQYYSKVFTLAALERITGINQKQLSHYSNGLKKPRKAQLLKIETALHNLSNELNEVHFYIA